MTESPTQQDMDALIALFPSWLITVDGSDRVLENHALVISGNEILAIDTAESVKTNYPNAKAVDLEGQALLPGLINAHGHSAMSLFRGLADDLPLMEWLNDHIWPAEGKWVSETFVRDGVRLAIGEMLKSGTTCFSDMYFFPNIAAQEADTIGMRAQLVCPLLDFPTVWASGPDEYLEKALNLAIEYSESQLVDVGLGPHAPYTVSDAPLLNAKELAIEHALPIQIHLHETAYEVEEAQEKNGQRPIERLSKLGFFEPEIRLQCVHMTALNESDIQTLASSNASVIHCPESNLKLASGFCPAEQLLRSGINLALGTDGAASNNDLDMFGEMRTAALIGKAVANDASALGAHKAIELATINGARALGIDSDTGSLEPGKYADIIAVDMRSLRSQPSYDVISDIVYSVSSSQVTNVWVAGRQQLKNGELLNLDERTLIETAKQWAQKIAASDDTNQP